MDLAQHRGMKVVIIGGGLGGICLANGMRKTGIEVRVFERHAFLDLAMKTTPFT